MFGLDHMDHTIFAAREVVLTPTGIASCIASPTFSTIYVLAP